MTFQLSFTGFSFSDVSVSHSDTLKRITNLFTHESCIFLGGGGILHSRMKMLTGKITSIAVCYSLDKTDKKARWTMTEESFYLLIHILWTTRIYLDLCFPTRLSHSRPLLTEAEATLAPCFVCAVAAQCLPPLTQSLHACWCEMQSQWSGRGSYCKGLSHEPGNRQRDIEVSHNFLTEGIWFRFVQGKENTSEISLHIWRRSILRPSVDIQYATCWGTKLVLD